MPRILQAVSIACLICGFLFSANAKAYFLASFSPTIDRDRETKIIVIGYSRGMRDRLLEAAVASGLRIRSVRPTMQVVFFIVQERKETAKSLERFGLYILQDTQNQLKPATLLNELTSFSKIASLDFFTHTHVLWGASIEGLKKSQSFSHKIPDIESLAGHFTSYGYIFFHGCNAGFVIAPALAKILQVPVAGPLASTAIERLGSGGHWREDDSVDKVKRKDWAEENAVSYETPIPCSLGACIRMRPDNHPYRGIYGSFSVGLGIYKFFCPNILLDTCEVAMAESLFAFPSERNLQMSDTQESFEAVLAEYICSSQIRARSRVACQLSLKQGFFSKLRDSFSGTEPLCSIEKCQIEINCDGKCKVTGTADKERRQMKAEYWRYLSGWLRMHKLPEYSWRLEKIQKIGNF
ncbi:MAG: hypothetical protein ACXWQO_06835 [Bdellovibrionota bacterium]